MSSIQRRYPILIYATIIEIVEFDQKSDSFSDNSVE